MERQDDTHADRGRFPTTVVAIAAVALAVIIALILIFSYFSSRYSYYGYGWGGMMGGWGFPMLFMFPIGIIILIIIGYVIYRSVWWGGGRCGHYGHNGHYGSDEDRETAMEILRRRYARGEITKEQFEQMKKDIVG